MEVIFKEVLEEMLQDTYHVEKLFDKEQLVKMWIEGIEKRYYSRLNRRMYARESFRYY